MMSLDEAIVHARDVAASASCDECAQEHLQLAKWLEELRARRIAERKQIELKI
jgi:hypothetical protein